MSFYGFEKIEYPLAKIIEVIAGFKDQPAAPKLVRKLRGVALERAMYGAPDTVLITRNLSYLMDVSAGFWVLAHGLEAQVDHENQARLRAEKQKDAETVANLKRRARSNPVAQFSFQAIDKNQTPVRFFDGTQDEAGVQDIGVYSELGGILLDVKLSEGKSVKTLVHEGRHSWQRHKFPELFPTDEEFDNLDSEKDEAALQIKLYITTKLIELDAWNADRAYTSWENEFRMDAFLRNVFQGASKELAAMKLKDKDPLPRCVTAEFFKETMASLRLGHYEESYIPQILPLIKSGELESTLKVSPFLQKAFLGKFLTRPNGKKFSQEETNDLCEHVISFVMTPHHPKLVNALESAGELKPSRLQVKTMKSAAKSAADLT